MSKKPNAWMAHVMRTKAANPGMQLKDVLRKAAETYKKDSGASSSTKHKSHKKHGGVLPVLGSMFGGRKRRGGEDLFGQTNAAETNAVETNEVQPPANEKELIQAGGGPLSPADVKNSGTALQLNATAYSGGKKSRRKSKGSRKGTRKSKGSRRHRK
jgi:hypothetical protein